MRRRILERLASGPLSVGHLAAGLPVSRPAVSQHLRVLTAAGLVTQRRVGTRRVYSVDPTGVGAIRKYWEEFWSTVLEHFRAAADGGDT